MTNKQIVSLKAKSKRYRVCVYPNVYIYVGTNNSKTFYARIKNENNKDSVIKLNKFSVSYGVDDAISDYNKLISTLTESQKYKFKTLDELFWQFLKTKEKIIAHRTYERYINAFKLFDEIKHEKPHEIKTSAIIECIKADSTQEKPRRAFSLINQLYEFAICSGEDLHSPLARVRPSILLGKIENKNHPTFTKPQDLTRLFNVIKNSNTNQLYKYALVLQSLTALRTQNIRAMRWEWINFSDGVLAIPSEQMKTKKPFYLPLNSQALKILKSIKAFLGNSSEWVFPAINSTKINPYISDNTLRMILRRGGITNDEFTPHGFRAMFSTIANDNNYSSEIIELCLAHVVGGVKGVYDRSHKLEAKRELMQWWGDYLEKFIKDFL